MSTTENTLWLEDTMDKFQDALDDQKYPVANDIICDVRDRGFEKEAYTMLFMLRNVKFDL